MVGRASDFFYSVGRPTKSITVISIIMTSRLKAINVITIVPLSYRRYARKSYNTVNDNLKLAGHSGLEH